jgi:hypothetical protein
MAKIARTSLSTFTMLALSLGLAAQHQPRGERTTRSELTFHLSARRWLTRG